MTARPADVFLLGGGWTPASRKALYGPFLESAGSAPVVACVVLDEGDGTAQFGRWAGALRATGHCDPAPVLVPEGGRLDPARLEDADALLVCGGLTPAYASALAPVAAELRQWLSAGARPYAGFSAGAAVAAGPAVVGGWLVQGAPVCPEDAAEELDEVLVTDGLGLVPWAVDVHAAQWGTLGRLVAAVVSGGVAGLAIDEDTAVHVQNGKCSVSGAGAAYTARPGGSAVTIERVPAGRTTGL